MVVRTVIKACVLGRFGDARASHDVICMYVRVAESIVVNTGCVGGSDWARAAAGTLYLVRERVVTDVPLS